MSRLVEFHCRLSSLSMYSVQRVPTVNSDYVSKLRHRRHTLRKPSFIYLFFGAFFFCLFIDFWWVCVRACVSVCFKWRTRCHQRCDVVAIFIAVYKRQYVTPSSSTTILATRYTITRSTRSPHPPPLCLKEFYPPPSLPPQMLLHLSSLRLFSPLVSFPPSLARMLAHYERLNGFR